MNYHEDAIDYFIDRVSEHLIGKLFAGKPIPHFKNHELALLLELGRGYTNPQIAQHLDCPVSTMTNRLTKLGNRLDMKRPRLSLLGAMLDFRVKQGPQEEIEPDPQLTLPFIPTTETPCEEAPN